MPHRVQGEPEPAPWWAINGIGMLLGTLEVIAGVSGIVYGPDGILGWVFRVGAAAGGAGLLWAYLRSNVRAETYSLIVVVSANLIDFVNELTHLEPFRLPTDTLVLQGAVVVFVAARIWALGKGGTFTIPPQRDDL